MRIVLGVLLIVLGLLLIQVSGNLVWQRGGLDLPDLFTFRWLSNIGGRMRGDGTLWLGVGILGIFMVGGGIWKLVRSKK